MRDPAFRRSYEAEHGLFVAEGETVVKRLLDSGWRVRSILVTARGARRLAEDLAGRDLEVLEVSDAVAQAVTGYDVHRGVLACAERKALPAASALLQRSRLALVLEDLTDQTNLGAAFRNAMALGADAVLLSPNCCDPLYRRSVRVSMGATFLLPFSYLGEWPAALASLSSTHRTVALTPDPEATDINDLPAGTEPCALVVGTEGRGLSPEALRACRERVRIGMRPGWDSLNLATATGIALHRLGPFGGGAGRDDRPSPPVHRD